MSGAGRGTNRVSPIGEAVVAPTNNEGTWVTLVGNEPPSELFHLEYETTEETIENLTTSFVESVLSSSNKLYLPRGTTRGGLCGSYIPGENGGILEVSIRWTNGDGGFNAVRVFSPSDMNNASYGPVAPADPNSVNFPRYSEAVALPPQTLAAGELPFVIPFWVPPVAWRNTLRNGGIACRVFVREGKAAVVTPGQVNLHRVIAENFGLAAPVARI